MSGLLLESPVGPLWLTAQGGALTGCWFVNGRFAPGAYEAVINSSVQIHHPEYWQAREKAISEQNRQAKKKGRER